MFEIYLLVNVEVLSHPKPVDPATVGAVVLELALVGVGLGYHGKLRVPCLKQVKYRLQKET